MPRRTGRPLLPCCPLPWLLLAWLPLAAGCWSGAYAKQEADDQVYPILEATAEAVTGQRRTFTVERPIDTLRQRLLTSTEPVHLTLLQALDVAAENSREFQRQKELLYLAALNLTRNQHDFEVRFGGGGGAEIAGVSDETAVLALSDDLSAAVTTTSGTRIVASFVNTFLRSVIGGGGFDGSSILDLTLTQPLLRGAGSDVVREPLTQAERDVVYQMRDFERFRATFAVDVISEYYGIVQQMKDLDNVEANYESVRQSRERTEEEFTAGRKTISDLGRERQSELTADNNRVLTSNRLDTARDRFKLLLGLPVTSQVLLDPRELDRLVEQGVLPFELDTEDAVLLALERRYDHRTVLDEVEDACRRVTVAENALEIGLDFTAALSVPSKDGSSASLDWSQVNWSAGFDLDLALDKLVERNAYRSALIALDAQIRAREASGDSIAAEVRSALRNIRSAYDSYRIQVEALRVAELRVESTTELYQAGRTQALEVQDARDSLLESQLSLTAAIVAYSVARLELMRDLEGLAMEPKGLRFDPALPLPARRLTEEQP